MSYCRFSSDDFNSDIYCYESCYGGYDIWVAANRYKGNIPKLNYETKEIIGNTYKEQMDYLETAEREKINLPYAGESFVVYGLSELKEKLLELKQIGYRVPDSAFKRIDEETVEE